MPVYLVQGMAFGDEGKGSIVDALVRRVNSGLVVRYNGGAQSAHNVVTKEGRHHTFSQFGSGTFVEGVATYLSRFVLVNPISMMVEEQALSVVGVHDAQQRLFVDQKCPVITPFHQAYNRLVEMKRGMKRHGSTGMGIGETRYIHLTHPGLAITVDDLICVLTLREKLKWQQIYYKNAIKDFSALVGSTAAREIERIEYEGTIDHYIRQYQKWVGQTQISDAMPTGYNNPVFEGSQGVLLDETHGFQPHTTWTDCTFNNADTILDESGIFDKRYRIGVWRCYFTRHGAGPLPSQYDSINIPEMHNKAEAFTGQFRQGAFDLPLALYANHVVGGIDGFAINHLDSFPHLDLPVRICRGQTTNMNSQNLFDMLEDLLRAPLVIQGHGPTSDDKSVDLGAIDAASHNDVWTIGLGKVN